jgi:hypothetical protein
MQTYRCRLVDNSLRGYLSVFSIQDLDVIHCKRFVQMAHDIDHDDGFTPLISLVCGHCHERPEATPGHDRAWTTLWCAMCRLCYCSRCHEMNHHVQGHEHSLRVVNLTTTAAPKLKKPYGWPATHASDIDSVATSRSSSGSFDTKEKENVQSVFDRRVEELLQWMEESGRVIQPQLCQRRSDNFRNDFLAAVDMKVYMFKLLGVTRCAHNAMSMSLEILCGRCRVTAFQRATNDNVTQIAVVIVSLRSQDHSRQLYMLS